MRIISGMNKGRKLHPPPLNNNSIRPTSDRAREALFNILGTFVRGSNFLDLFAGTGAVGLEAHSRFANAVCFVDWETTSLQLLKKNISLCTQVDNSKEASLTVLKLDLSHKTALKRLISISEAPFDIIFADPPYGKGLACHILTAIGSSSLVKPDGIVIIEERKNTALPEDLGSLSCTDKREYGENGFWLYRKIL